MIGAVRFCLNSRRTTLSAMRNPNAITTFLSIIFRNSIKATHLPPPRIDHSSSSSDTQTMNFSYLAVIVALTASMSVSACKDWGTSCKSTSECCTNKGLVCSQTAVGIVCCASNFQLMTRLLFFVNQKRGVICVDHPGKY
jgi:hypothetical protein